MNNYIYSLSFKGKGGGGGWGLITFLPERQGSIRKGRLIIEDFITFTSILLLIITLNSNRSLNHHSTRECVYISWRSHYFILWCGQQ